MRYTIFTTDVNKTMFGISLIRNAYVVDSAIIRNECLMNEVQRKSCVQVMYKPLYINGEYGKLTVVKYDDIVDFRGISRDIIARNGGII